MVAPAPSVLAWSAAPFTDHFAHGAPETILAARVRESRPGSTIDFVDQVRIPAGRAVPVHRHAPDDEELYVIVSGRGVMTVEQERIEVGPGDVVVNRPGGAHGIENTGDVELHMVVVQVATSDRGRDT